MTKRPPISVRTFWMPRAGHTADEYEDASGASDSSSSPFRAVVADGATESAFSGEWARALVATYIAEGDLVGAAAAARAHFAPPPDVRWYVQAKADEGAHATLLGLEIDGDAWRAESVGDCCLFLVRDDEIYRSWPFGRADRFHHRPDLISSRAPLSADHVAATTGIWQEGDSFILATDAVAAWLLEQGVEPLLTTDNFETMIDAARAATTAVTRRTTEAEDGGVGAAADRTSGSPAEATAHGPTRNTTRRTQPRRPCLRNDDVTVVLIEWTP